MSATVWLIRREKRKQLDFVSETYLAGAVEATTPNENWLRRKSEHWDFDIILQSHDVFVRI